MHKEGRKLRKGENLSSGIMEAESGLEREKPKRAKEQEI